MPITKPNPSLRDTDQEVLLDALEPRLFLSAQYHFIDVRSLGVQGQAIDMNDAGELKGTTFIHDCATCDEGSERGFFWSKETGMVDLGGFDALGRGPNTRFPRQHSHDMTVEIIKAEYPYRLRTLKSGVLLHDYGSIEGSAIILNTQFNDSGTLIGTASSPHRRQKVPFMARDGVLVNLNRFLPAGCGWKLEHTRAINNAGEILVEAETKDGVLRDFIMRPVADADVANVCPSIPPVIEDEAGEEEETSEEPAETDDESEEEEENASATPSAASEENEEDDADEEIDDERFLTDDNDPLSPLDLADGDEDVWDEDDELEWEPQDLLA